jgi:hypothetical protein
MNGHEVTKEMLKVFSSYQKANDLLMKKWCNIIFLTPRWWLGVLLGTIPWLLWWKFHNKSNTGDLLRAGFFMATISLVLDSIGIQLGLWIYPYDVVPFIPGYIPWDLTLLPITVMFIIEIKPQLSPIKKAIIFSFLTAFIGEPIFDFIKIYEPIHWNSLYSFPIYILLFLISNKLAKSNKFNSNFD